MHTRSQSTKGGSRLVRLLLAVVLAVGLMPLPAFGTEPPEDNENLFWVEDNYIWGYTLNGTLQSSSMTGIPDEYGEDYYNFAYAAEVILRGGDDGDTITVALQSYEFDSTEIDYYMEYGYGLISAIGSSHEEVGDFEEIKADAANHYSESEDAFLFDVELVDGEAQLVAFLYADEYVDEDITGIPIVVSLYTEEAYNNRVKLVDVEPAYGQLENINALFGLMTNANRSLIGFFATYLIVPNGMDSVEATLTFNESDIDVSVNGVNQGPISAEDNTLTVTLNAAQKQYKGPSDDSKNVIHLSKDGAERDYTIWAVNQRFDDLPDRVVDFLSVNSQYTNDRSVAGSYGTNAIRSLVGSNWSAGSNASGPVSLGNFGGYITYFYEDAITDDPDNPYGVDFITYGNSVEGSNEFGEVGQVWVSEDGENWYALAGGMHYEDYADWNYSVTYTKVSDGHAAWTDSRGKSKVDNGYYPLPEYYPWHTFADGEEEMLTLSGIYFPEDYTDGGGIALAPFAGFGYTDLGQRGCTLNEETGEWGHTWPSTYESEYELHARNIAANPYLPTQVDPKSGRTFSYGTDGMDLAWAVDADGQPVDFPNGIHYVKIVTATNISNPALGEKSTEVNMVRVARANESAVGKTDAPAKITVDGVDVALEEGKFVYDDVAVEGPFEVAVDAPEGTNIYINNNCSSSANYDNAPAHGIIRVIVQEGEREPLIYIFNLHEVTEAEKAEALAALENAIESAEATLEAVAVSEDGKNLPDGTAYVTPTAKQALADAVAAAEAVLANDDATLAEINDATSALADAVAAFGTAKKTASVDGAALDAAIKNAEAVSGQASVSADGSDVDPSDKWVTQDVADELAVAIVAAKDVAANAGSTQAQVDAAVKAVTAAAEKFEAAMKPGTKSDEPPAPAVDKAALDTAIADAKAIEQGKKANDAYKALQDAIAAAQKTSSDKGATQAQVDAAKKALDDAVKAFNASEDQPDTPEPPTPAADKTALQALVDKVGAPSTDDVVFSQDGSDVPANQKWRTEASAKAFQDAFAAAEKVLADDAATQAQVDAALAALESAAADYAPKPGTAPVPPDIHLDELWTRLYGENAFQTMSAIVDEGNFEKGGTVVLASLEGYWDALTAAGVAGLENAPVLTTTPDGLSSETTAQLKKLAPKKIVVCGGTYWIPEEVVAEAAAAAGTSPATERLAGEVAVNTAEAIAKYGEGKWSDTAILVTVGTFQDALAAAPVSYAKAMPIYLAQFDFATETGSLAQTTIDSMKANNIVKVYIAGGTYWLPQGVKDQLAAAGIEVVDQLMGETAVETSAAIAKEAVSELGFSANECGLADARAWYDALASASFCGKNESVLLLVDPANDSCIDSFVGANADAISHGYVFGGANSVSDELMIAAQEAGK